MLKSLKYIMIFSTSFSFCAPASGSEDDFNKSIASLPRIKTSNTGIEFGIASINLSEKIGNLFIVDANVYSNSDNEPKNYEKWTIRHNENENEIFKAKYDNEDMIPKLGEFKKNIVIKDTYINCKSNSNFIKYLNFQRGNSLSMKFDGSLLFDIDRSINVNNPYKEYYISSKNLEGNILQKCGPDGKFEGDFSKSIFFNIISSLSDIDDSALTISSKGHQQIIDIISYDSKKTPEYVKILNGYYYKFGRSEINGEDYYVSSNLDRIVEIGYHFTTPEPSMLRVVDFVLKPFSQVLGESQFNKKIPDFILKEVRKNPSLSSIEDAWSFDSENYILYSLNEDDSRFLNLSYISYKENLKKLNNNNINSSLNIAIINRLRAINNIYRKIKYRKFSKKDFYDITDPLQNEIYNNTKYLAWIYGDPEAMYDIAIDMNNDSNIYYDLSRDFLLKAINSPLAEAEDLPRYKEALAIVTKNIAVNARNAELQAIRDRESEARADARRQERDRQNLSLIFQTVQNMKQQAEAEARAEQARRERQRQEAAEQARLQAQREQTAAYERQQQLNRQAADQRAFNDRRAAAIQAQQAQQQQQMEQPSQSYAPPQQSYQSSGSSNGNSQAQADAERRRQEQLAQERQQQQQLQASYARAMDFIQAQASSNTNRWALSLYNRNNFRVQCTVSVDGESWAYGSSTPFHDSQVLIIASGEQRDAQWSPLREGDGSNSRTRRILNNQYICRAMP